MVRNKLVYIRGGGDLATGTACRLLMAGFQVMISEIPVPTVIRRTVSLAQCIFDGEARVEGVCSRPAGSLVEALDLVHQGIIPVLVDPWGEQVEHLKPDVVVDAILAKKNTGVNLDWAPVVIGLGPGFTAGVDVHAVVETQRGHYLGRVYYQGSALPDTGRPGEIEGHDEDRIVRAPESGIFLPAKEIGDWVEHGGLLGHVGSHEVLAPLTGTLRGLLNSGIYVKKGMKIGDIDPRQVPEYCRTISDKARAVAGGVLEAILYLSP